MFFGKTQSLNQHLTTRTNPKKPSSLACLGLAFIFLTTVLMSGCVVHSQGHGYKKGHGHHKGKIKIKPRAEISVSPMIVIDD